MLDNSCAKSSGNPFIFLSFLLSALCSRLERSVFFFIARDLYAFENSHPPTYPQLVAIYVLKIAKSADLIHCTTSVLSWECKAGKIVSGTRTFFLVIYNIT